MELRRVICLFSWRVERYRTCLVLTSSPSSPLLPCSRFRIWISGCQTLQCLLTPRLSHPLSWLFPSCPQFSTSFSFWLPKTLSVPPYVASRFSPHLLSTLPAFHRSSNMFLSHSAAALRFHACMCDVFRHLVCKACGSKLVRCSLPQLLS